LIVRQIVRNPCVLFSDYAFGCVYKGEGSFTHPGISGRLYVVGLPHSVLDDILYIKGHSTDEVNTAAFLSFMWHKPLIVGFFILITPILILETFPYNHCVLG
jgi:hypothetical protein